MGAILRIETIVESILVKGAHNEDAVTLRVSHFCDGADVAKDLP